MEIEKGVKLRTKRGFHRLGILLGALCAAAWIILQTFGVIEYPRNGRDYVLVGLLISFFLPWGAFRAIPWVMAGFVYEKGGRPDKEDPTNQRQPEAETFVDAKSHITEGSNGGLSRLEQITLKLGMVEKRVNRVTIIGSSILLIMVLVLLAYQTLPHNQILSLEKVQIRDPMNRVRMEMGLTEKGEPELTFMNEVGKPVNRIASAAYLLYDVTGGKILANLSLWGLPSDPTGQFAQLDLYDTKGRFVFGGPFRLINPQDFEPMPKKPKERVTGK